MKHRQEIDGLRALAVLPVILFHAGFQNFSGGFVGVDIFFVISGYLITSIILTEKQAGTFTLISFYERRARRILPALYLVIFSCLPFAWLWMWPSDMKDFSQSLIAVSTFVSNIFFSKKSGYFDTDIELNPLLHTWSLGVEEQYYVLFPIVLLLTWRLGKQWIVGILIVAAIISLAIAQWGSLHNPVANFYLLQARGWELLTGVFIAFYFSHVNSIEAQAENAKLLFNQSASLFGLALITYAVFTFDKSTPFPGLYALMPTVGASLIILFANQQTLVGRLLSSKVLVGVGLISYSWYLWHQPLFAFARYRSVSNPSVALMLLLTLASFVLAYISWKYVEKPFRNNKQVGRTRVFVFGLVGGFSLLTFGLVGHLTNGYENYYYANRLDNSQRHIYSMLRNYTGGNMYLEMGDNGDCNFWSMSIDREFNKRFLRCSAKYGKATIVLGDSHAMNIYNALYRSNFDKFVVGISKGGCRPHNNRPDCHYDSFDSFVLNNRALIRYVIFHQSGSYLLKDYMGRVDSADTFVDGRKYGIHYENIIKTSQYLNNLSNLVDVVWLGPFVEARINYRDVRLNGFTSDSLEMNKAALKIFERLDSELEMFIANKEHKFKYVSLSKILKIDKDFLIFDNCLTYRNEDHFSVCGEKIIGDKLKVKLSGIAEKTGRK